MRTRPLHVQRRFDRRLRLLQIPADLSGKTVLDIGAWDGYFSFEFERRGAKRVLAIDSYAWSPRPGGFPRGLECFLLGREFYNSKVEYQRLDLYDLDPAAIGTFDLVFCAGVLYHMRHPLLGLEKIRSVTAGQLILETHQLIPAVHERIPLIRFFPGDEEAVARDKSPGGFPTRAWVVRRVDRGRLCAPRIRLYRIVPVGEEIRRAAHQYAATRPADRARLRGVSGRSAISRWTTERRE